MPASKNVSATNLVAFEYVSSLVPGDVDGAGAVAFEDGIAVLNILAGETSKCTIAPRADVNADDAIGLEEVISVMRTKAKLK